MQIYVLDTNFFFNLEIKSGFGNNPKEIIEAITDYSRKLKKSKSAAFYMPPDIVKEMLTFVNENDDYVKNFLAEISIKAPERSSVAFPSSNFYEMVQEIRERSYRGLQIAEEEVDATATTMLKEGDLSKIEYQKKVGEHVTRLRERYRNATRTKFLDSVADLDVIVLAKELNGYVVSSDEGVIRWARKFGVKEAVPQVLKQQLDSLLLA